MEKGLVSIVTPCYNGEEYIDTFAKAVLAQTYSNIELIFVDDGSKDKTKEIINSYKSEFEKKNIRYLYIYQENKGQAAALNTGLKEVKGEFLTWPDSDDILYKNSIEKRVEFFKKNPQYDLVRNEVNIVDFDTKQKVGEFKLKVKDRTENIFENLIFYKKIFYSPISYMIRTEKFLKLNPERKIFVTRFGQNWQMLLPISYYSKCGYLDEVLCDYIVRQNSHSRQKYKTIHEELSKLDKHIEILREVLTPMNLFQIYENRIYLRYDKLKLKQAYYYQDEEVAKKVMKELKKHGNPNVIDYLCYYAAQYKFLYKLIKLLRRKEK